MALLENFMEGLRRCPKNADDMPHIILHVIDDRARHDAAVEVSDVLGRIDRCATGEKFRHDVAQVTVPFMRDPVPVKFASSSRGIFIDVGQNMRRKNGVDLISDDVAEGVLAFIKSLSQTRDMQYTRRLLVIENFDLLPVHATRWFKRIVERITNTSWVVLTMARITRVDAAFLGHFCIVRHAARRPLQDADGRRLSLLRSPEETPRNAVARMVARLGKARTCSDLMTAKIPRSVTALGARGFMKNALGAALDQAAAASPSPSSSSSDPNSACRVPSDDSRDERMRALTACITKYDVMQTWGKFRGNIGDDDEAFVDTVIMCTLLHTYRYLHRNWEE